ncbi:MAG: type IV pilus modification PilV family protein [Planctomycetota bacterium]|jgi:prepilin-type N-terminal cleavage/methylation domain-containing protein
MTRRIERNRGFSLVELLMAIFILGIGVISIASLFPAGIAQQRRSVDDVLGPIVANNALSILRGKLSDGDFAFNISGYTVEGDFPWLRPAFFLSPGSVNSDFGGNISVPAGSISVFRSYGASTDTDMPYNTLKYGNTPPTIIVTQGERAFPSYPVVGDPRRAQYYWDCMFRRFQGRMQVAIFVYRVTDPQGPEVGYVVASNPSNPDVPPLPVQLDITWDSFPAGNPTPEAIIPGTPNNSYNPFDQAQSWQQPRQWILDQNNNIHRVLGAFNDDGDRFVELVRPVPELPGLQVYAFPSSAQDTNGNGLADQDVVGAIWYIPAVDGLGRSLTPVYLAVEEL